MGSGITESVARVAEEQEATRRAKQRYGELAAKRWDCADLRTLLGPELMPSRASKSFLERMKTLAGKMPDAEKPVELLRAARDERLKMPGAIKDSALQPRDVNVVLQGLKGGKRIRGITESVLESGLESAGEATEGRLMESVAAPMVESMAESTAESMVGKTVVESMAWSTLKSSVESTVESSATAECDGDTQWGMDEHNDTLEDEAKRGEEDISELITRELEKGLLRNIYMMRTVKLQ